MKCVASIIRNVRMKKFLINVSIIPRSTDRPENIFEALIWSSSRQDQLDKVIPGVDNDFIVIILYRLARGLSKL